MGKVLLNAHLPSINDLRICNKKFEAFTSASASQTALEQGLTVNERTNNASYFLSNSTTLEPGMAIICNHDSLTLFASTHSNDNGLRVAMQLIYDPDSTIVKSCVEVEKTTKIRDSYSSSQYKTVTSKAPVITFGKKQYIWLNKEECENNSERTMRCISLELVEKAVPFSEKSNNDFVKAHKIHSQCERVVTEDCTLEELEMLVSVKMNNKDRCRTAEPIFTKKQEKMLEAIIKKISAKKDDPSLDK